MPSSSRDTIGHAEAVALEERTLELLAWKTLQRPPYASTMAADHPYRTLNPTQQPSRWKSAPYELLA